MITSISSATPLERLTALMKNKPSETSAQLPTAASTTAPASSSTVTISPAAMDASNAADLANAAVAALTRLGVSQYANGVDLNGSPQDVTFALAGGTANGQVTQADLEQRVVAGGGTKQDADALYAQMIAVRPGGASGDAPLTQSDFEGSLSSTSLGGGTFVGQMDGVFGSNGQVTVDQLKTVLEILAARGTQPSTAAAQAAVSTPAGRSAMAEPD